MAANLSVLVFCGRKFRSFVSICVLWYRISTLCPDFLSVASCMIFVWGNTFRLDLNTRLWRTFRISVNISCLWQHISAICWDLLSSGSKYRLCLKTCLWGNTFLTLFQDSPMQKISLPPEEFLFVEAYQLSYSATLRNFMLHPEILVVEIRV